MIDASSSSIVDFLLALRIFFINEVIHSSTIALQKSIEYYGCALTIDMR